MPDAISPSAAAAPATPFDPALIFTILVEEPRRRMLLALAGGPPLSADALGGAAGRTRGATLKHLALLSQAGLVVARPDPSAGQPKGGASGRMGRQEYRPVAAATGPGWRFFSARYSRMLPRAKGSTAPVAGVFYLHDKARNLPDEPGNRPQDAVED